MVWVLKKLRRFVWKKLLESKALLSSNYFHTNLLTFFEIQTIIKSHSLMLGTSNFSILVFSICSFHFWHSLSYSPYNKRFLGKLWSCDPSCKGPIVPSASSGKQPLLWPLLLKNSLYNRVISHSSTGKLARSFQNVFHKCSIAVNLVFSRNWVFHEHHILGYHSSIPP